MNINNYMPLGTLFNNNSDKNNTKAQIATQKLFHIYNNKKLFMITSAKEKIISDKYGYPISVIRVYIPNNMNTNTLHEFICNFFRESDIIYANERKKYFTITLPYTHRKYLPPLTKRLNETFRKIYPNETLKYKVSSHRNKTQSASPKIAPYSFINILQKFIHTIKREMHSTNFINYYCGLKIIHDAKLVSLNNDIFTFKLDPLQLIAINYTKSIEMKLEHSTYSISASIVNINFIKNELQLKNLYVVEYCNITSKSLTIEYKNNLKSQLVCENNETINFNITSLSVDKIYGSTQGLLINMDKVYSLQIDSLNSLQTLKVKPIYKIEESNTDSREHYLFKIVHQKEKEYNILQDCISTRSRECILELQDKYTLSAS